MQYDLNNTVLVFFGAPGSGKGTLARMLEERLGFKVLSTGDLCRKHIRGNTEIGLCIKDQISKGQLISDDLITKMVKGWLDNKLSLKKSIILDGYPRTASQAKLFNDLCKKEKYKFNFRVILFEISDEIVIDRLKSRLICSNRQCQAIFSTKTQVKEGDKCLKCDSILLRREDDKESVVEVRFKSFLNDKQLFEQYYNGINQPLEKLEIDGKTQEEVFEAFIKMLNE